MNTGLICVFAFVQSEVDRIIGDAIGGALPRKDWDKVAKLLEMFSEDIKNDTGLQGVIKRWEEELNGETEHI